MVLLTTTLQVIFPDQPAPPPVSVKVLAVVTAPFAIVELLGETVPPGLLTVV